MKKPSKTDKTDIAIYPYVMGRSRPDVKVIALCKKWGYEYALLQNSNGEIAICTKGGNEYGLTAAWVGWEKDFVYLNKGMHP